MTTGEKIYKLRREQNLTQEQLADVLGVSRQAVSRWESDVTLPETDKLLALSGLLGCSVDELLGTGDLTDRAQTEETATKTEKAPETDTSARPRRFHFEYKSKTTLFGMPLLHINIGLGRCAKGFFAIGLSSVGVVSAGLLSLGIVSFGVIALGLLALACFSLGIVSMGAVSAGVFSFGAIAFGLVSVGAVAIGDFSVGALAVGKYLAVGDNARAAVAVGSTVGIGTEYGFCSGARGSFLGVDMQAVRTALSATVPPPLRWIGDLIASFLETAGL